jgi:hypothetical protein
MSSLINLLDISVTDAVELEQKINYNLTTNFSDGELDGINNFEPIAYQWFNSDYHKGYLVGIAKRIGTEYANMEVKDYAKLS